MGTLLQFTVPRDLKLIVAEIIIDGARLSKLMRQCQGRDPTESEDLAWDVLEQRIDANKAEAKARVCKLTGIDWQELEAALS